MPVIVEKEEDGFRQSINPGQDVIQFEQDFDYDLF